MKKVISALCFMLIGWAASAQITLYSQYSKVTDSISTSSSTATKYLTTATNALSGISLNGAYDVQVTATNVSGTTNIKAILQGSNDGLTWENLHGTVGTNGINCDTFLFSGTATHIYTVHTGSFKEYRARNGSVVDSIQNNYLVPTNAGRRYYIRVAFVAPSSTQLTIIKANLITQN